MKVPPYQRTGVDGGEGASPYWAQVSPDIVLWQDGWTLIFIISIFGTSLLCSCFTAISVSFIFL